MKKRRGISILVEAVVVAILVISSFSIAYYYITPANPRLQRSQVDLNKMGFNLLNSLASSHAFDNTIINSTALFDYYNNCTYHSPSVVITPPAVWADAGSQVTYTVTVVNNDDECGTETFSLNAVMPNQAWQYVFSQNYVFLKSGGDNASVTLYVTSPLNAVSSNTFSVTASNLGASLYGSNNPHNSSTAYANYTITSSCSYSKPTIAVTPGSNWTRPGTQASYNLTIYNNDASICGYSQFTAFVSTNTAGVTASFNSNSNQANDTVSVQSGGNNITIPFYVNSLNNFSGISSINVTVVQSGKSISPAAAQPVSFFVNYVGPRGSYNYCNNPTVLINPASAWVPAGTNYSYTITVYNNDYSGCQSSPETYNLTPNGLSGSGWTYNFNMTSVTVASGQNKNVTLFLKSPSNGNGNVSFTVTATSGSKSSTSNTAIYVIKKGTPASCAKLPPSLALLLPSQWSSAGGTAKYKVIVVNNDNSVCNAAETINLSASVRPGWTAIFLNSSLTVQNSGGVNTTYLLVTSPAGAVNANNINITDIPVTAINQYSNEITTYNATYIIPQACTTVNYTCISTAKGIMPGWQRNIELALLNLIPPGYIFNLNVSLIAVSIYTPYQPEAIQLNNGILISNAPPQSFKTASQVGSVTYVYTTPRLYILVFNLQLAQVTQP